MKGEAGCNCGKDRELQNRVRFRRFRFRDRTPEDPGRSLANITGRLIVESNIKRGMRASAVEQATYQCSLRKLLASLVMSLLSIARHVRSKLLAPGQRS
jgi:hypothetical protein